MDGDQQRRHLREPAVEDLRRRPGGDRADVRRRHPVNESGRKELAADEVRFTTKGDSLYAFIMGWPEKMALIKALATTSPLSPPKIRNVELLGYNDKVIWTQDEQGLTVVMPEQKPCDYAITLKII